MVRESQGSGEGEGRRENTRGRSYGESERFGMEGGDRE